MPSEDARYRTKVYLEQYIDNANLTEDDDSTTVKFIVAFAFPDYPWLRVFQDKSVSLVFAIGKPDSDAIIDSDRYIIGYNEHVPIFTFAINKANITGTKLNWKAEAEFRRVVEEYPLGSNRTIQKIQDAEQNLGSTVVYGSEYILSYERDKT